MGQFILFLLALFIISCILYGISAGVQVIQHGFIAYLAKRTCNDTPDTAPLVTQLPQRTNKAAAVPTTPQEEVARSTARASATATDAPSPIECSIDELERIFTLYQQGALTREEFESMKQCLLMQVTQIH